MPTRFADLILGFSPLFRHRTWRHAQDLLRGAILAPGVRTVASVLRCLGLSAHRRFVNYHRVLGRAAWSPRLDVGVLLRLLVRTFVPREAPIVLGLDSTLERRRGAHRRQGDLSRRGALLVQLLRQGERPALACDDAAGRGAFCTARLDTAGVHGTLALRAPSPRAAGATSA